MTSGIAAEPHLFLPRHLDTVAAYVLDKYRMRKGQKVFQVSPVGKPQRHILKLLQNNKC